MTKEVNHEGGVNQGTKYLVNALGRFIGSRLRANDNMPTPLISKIDDLFRRRTPSPETVLGDEQYNKLHNLHSQTKLWHGTGRYQYKDGKAVDILRFITSHGALHPQPDTWDFAGSMTTISLAPSRMYARAYADMHGKGIGEPGRYGSSFFWAALFVGDMKVEGLIEGKAWTPKGLQAVRRHIVKNTDLWYRKISQQKRSTMEAFYFGSDIPNNYPIIFGVRGERIDQAATTRTVAIHEVRAHNPISLDEEVSYIEVPRERMSETQDILTKAGYSGLPLTAIEDNEAYMAAKALSQLITNTWTQQNIVDVDRRDVLKSLL